jgi:hypothetical protein
MFSMRRIRAATEFAFRVIFGAFAVLIGSSITVWIFYNQFVSRLPQYRGFHWWEPLGIGPLMIGVGIYWLRGLRIRRCDETNAPQTNRSQLTASQRYPVSTSSLRLSAVLPTVLSLAVKAFSYQRG